MIAGLPDVSPAVVLSVVVGTFNACLYVVLRGTLRPHVLLVLPAAVAGAYIGQAVGGHFDDPVRMGDYSLLWASAVAWMGIFLAVGVTALLPSRRAD